MSIIKESSISKKDFVFYLFFFFISLAQSFGIGSQSNPVIIFISAFAFFLAAFKIVSTKYTKKEIIIVSFLIIYAVISYLFSSNILFLINFISIIAIKNIDIKKLIKFLFYYRLFGFLIVIFLNFVGLLPDNNVYLFRNGMNTFIVRNSLGFYHPNMLFVYFFTLISMYIYTYFDKINVKHLIILTILSVFFYNISLSRTGFLASILIILITFLVKYFKGFDKVIINKITIYISIFPAIFMVFSSIIYTYNRGFLSLIDKAISNRIYLSSVYLKEYGLSIFGVFTESRYYIGGMKVIIDSAYISILISFGIFGMLLFILSLIKLSKYFYKNKMIVELYIFLIFVLYCINEQSVASVMLNFPLLFLSMILFKKKGGERNDT